MADVEYFGIKDSYCELNDRQIEAVHETEGYVRVIAGAGSGKTKLLVSRYAFLVKECGIDPANILCVTFTNKAAGEMKKRVRALIGEGYDTTLICTYHGFCNRLIREDSEKLFLNKQFQIIDNYQQKSIMAEIYQKHDLRFDYASFEAMLKRLSLFKSKPSYVPRMCSPEPCIIMKEIKTLDDELLEEFLQWQKATYSLDFNDLIMFALHILENNEDVRNKWQERLNYIMVDEFQDSSSTEMDLIEILSARYKNLLIVGDPDQNIYEWRGSDVKLLVDFDKSHIPTKTIILNQNYRSTPEILKCANTLIEKNVMRLKKDLFTDNGNGAGVIHYHSKNDYVEMDQVIKNIKDLRRKESLKYSDFAILYRSGFLSRIAEKKLVENGIPYEIFGGVKFYERMEIRDLLAYLNLIAYDDDNSLKRIINTPRRRFGRVKLSLLEQLREEDLYMNPGDGIRNGRISLYETLRAHSNDKAFSDSDIGAFIDFVENTRETIKDLPLSETVNNISASSGYEGYIRGLGDEERLDNLVEFKRIANEFEKDFGENVSLERFLQQIALQSGEQNDPDLDAVKLMTIHAAKGLEFPTVFILGFTEGIFPSYKTIEERKLQGLEEERRLCYVAITRAQKHLFLLDSEGVSPQGIKKECSRFIDEIGEENYVRIGQIIKDDARGKVRPLNTDRSDVSPALPFSRKIGDEVEHRVFGKGKIVGQNEKRGNYSVLFENMSLPRNISSRYFEKDIAVHEKPEEEIIKSSELMIPEEEREQQDIPDLEITDSVEMPVMTDEVEHDLFLPVYNDATEQKGVIKGPNLWKDDSVPKTGWECVGVDDLGKPVGICQMCGSQIIRYAHNMVHPSYSPLVCGCVCAGRMEGNIERARKRENEFKNKQARQLSFVRRKWHRSRKGNEYLRIDNHVVVLYNIAGTGKWKYSIDNVFSRQTYSSRESALRNAFEDLDRIRVQLKSSNESDISDMRI